MASLLLNACAVQKRYGFTARSVTKISYDPKRCVELTDGTYKCKDVIFPVSSIQPVAVKSVVGAEARKILRSLTRPWKGRSSTSRGVVVRRRRHVADG